MFAGKKSAQIREILISESAWEEMTCLFAPSLDGKAAVLQELGLNSIQLWFVFNPLARPLFHLPSRPLNPQRFGLLQYGLYGFFLAIGRVFVFAQDALDHQAQLGAHAFAG